MTTITSTPLDYARFTRAALSTDPTRAILSRPFDLRLAAPFEAGPLGRYDFCACDGHRLHAWRADRYVPADPRRYDDPEEGRPPDFFSLPFRVGRPFRVFRLALQALLPAWPPRRGRPSHALLFHADGGADALRFFLVPQAPPAGEAANAPDLPPGGALVNALFVRDALVGMPEEFTLYLPEDPHQPLTFEGEGALALVMPLRSQ